MNIFSSLGFHWDRSAVPMAVATHSIELVTFRFHRMLPEFVWDASMLEGNPFTFPEVKTLLEGVTIGGRKISDQEHVLNLASGSQHLLELVKDGSFSLDKATFTELHNLVARSEALDRGHFRGEGNETHYTPDVGLGEYGVLSRNRRKFRQPINVACPAPGRWGRPNSRVTSRHFDHGNASRTSRPDCSGLDEAD